MKQNMIEVKMLKSKYCAEDHLCIVIDEIPLDVLLHTLYPNNNLLGMIPTIIEWVSDPREKSLLINRLKSTNKLEMLPVLMCPDDCDLLCTLIVAEVIKEDDKVYWRRIGVDISNISELNGGYECIGSKVEWLENVPQMCFDQIVYNSQINKLYK